MQRAGSAVTLESIAIPRCVNRKHLYGLAIGSPHGRLQTRGKRRRGSTLSGRLHRAQPRGLMGISGAFPPGADANRLLYLPTGEAWSTQVIRLPKRRRSGRCAESGSRVGFTFCWGRSPSFPLRSRNPCTKTVMCATVRAIDGIPASPIGYPSSVIPSTSGYDQHRLCRARVSSRRARFLDTRAEVQLSRTSGV